jgi:hypothetical protein
MKQSPLVKFVVEIDESGAAGGGATLAIARLCDAGKEGEHYEIARTQGERIRINTMLGRVLLYLLERDERVRAELNGLREVVNPPMKEAKRGRKMQTLSNTVQVR